MLLVESREQLVNGSYLEWRHLYGLCREGRSGVERLAVGVGDHSWVSGSGSVHMSGAHPSV